MYGVDIKEITAETTGRHIDVIKMIEMVDRGNDHVYIVDEHGCYSGQAVMLHHFAKIWYGDSSFVSSVPPILEEQGDMKGQFARLKEAYPALSEFPVLRGGRIASVLSCASRSKSKLKWNVVSPYLSDELAACTRIYLSSLENENIYNFYRKFSTQLPLVPLSKECLKDALEKDSPRGGDNLLVFAHDVFPPCRKTSIENLWNHLAQLKLRFHASLCCFRKDYAEIQEKDAFNLGRLIRMFDSGHQAIAVVDEQGRYLRTVYASTMAKHFPRKRFPQWENLFLEYTDDEEELKRRIAVYCFGTGRQEVPLLKDGRVIAAGWRTNTDNHEIQKKFPTNIFPLYWELLSDEVILEYFRNSKKILVSSDKGALAAFKRRCGRLLDITVYDDSILFQYLAGEFDYLVYGAAVWGDASTPKSNVVQLYADLLAEEVRRYLEHHQVWYYYLDVKGPVYDQLHRIQHRKEDGHIASLMYANAYGDYFVMMDTHLENRVHISGGRRRVVDAPSSNYRQSIHVYGICTALGSFDADEKTIESQLQKILNHSMMTCRVVNHGNQGGLAGAFNDIGSLHKIMDTKLCRGDIVILMGQSLWRMLPNRSAEWKYSLSQVLDRYDTRFDKYFQDAHPAHMYGKGYRLIAEFLWEKIKNHLAEGNVSREQVPSMFSRLAREQASGDEENPLQHYLEELGKHRVERDSIGAIVMNCNPFTRGHLYLIEKARTQVDFCYIFVVEEDKSEISFKDRFAMVEENCRKFPDVKVLPSGRYMISSMTFAEYFQKEQLQGKTEILPAQDVRIFGQSIAPCLHIKKRFVGEEPLDMVTKQYNDALRSILPDYGVELVEIPRLQLSDGEPVNATSVRSLLKRGELESCQKYLTKETYLYIKTHRLRL